MKTAFEQKQLGLAASMTVIITIVLIVLTTIQKKLFGNDEHDA